MSTALPSPRTGSAVPLSEAEIRLQLQRIQASAGFHSSARMSRFLRFAVEETLASGPEAVKEVTVAMAVFDRPADFNPKLDPVVRNEARRLRVKLEAYYTGEGLGDRVRISILKGGYAPHFDVLETTTAAALPTAGLPVAAVAPTFVVAPTASSAQERELPIDGGLTSSPKKPSFQRTAVLWIAAAVVLAAVTAVGAVVLNRAPKTSALAVSVRPLTSDVGHDFSPAISPDGQSIAFTREGPDGNLDIYVQTMGGEPRRLTTDIDNDLHPSWSPDGQSIAFIRAGRTPPGSWWYPQPADPRSSSPCLDASTPGLQG